MKELDVEPKKIPELENVQFTMRGRKFHSIADPCTSWTTSRRPNGRNAPQEVQEERPATARAWGKTACLECFGGAG
jgi:hypothetical protein